MTLMNKSGRKDDQGKPRWSLMPIRELSQVLAVLEHGANKYGVNNWVNITPLRARYFNAAMRHLTAWWLGEKNDPETGLSHLAHSICCLIFLLWSDNNNSISDINEKDA